MSQRVFDIRGWENGQVSYPDAADIAENAAQIIRNARTRRPGLTIPRVGSKVYASGPTLDSGYTLQHVAEFYFNSLDTLIAFATHSTNTNQQRLYFSQDQGSNWTEITEFHQTTVDTPTDESNFTIVSGSAVDDFYNNWYAFIESGGFVSVVQDYTGSTKSLSLHFDIISGTLAGGENITLMRFPIYRPEEVYAGSDNWQKFFDDKPVYVPRYNAVSMYGSNTTGDDSGTSILPKNLWFGYVSRNNILNQSALDFSGMHAEHKRLTLFKHGTPSLTLTSSFSSDDNDPFPAGDYLMIQVAVFDGYQSSPAYWDVDNLIVADSAVTVPEPGSGPTYYHLNARVNWRYTDYVEANNGQMPRHFATRRVTAFAVYLAEGKKIDTSSNVWQPTSPFYRVKQVDIDDSSWGLTGAFPGVFEINLTIKGVHWAEAQRLYESEFVTGYFAQNQVEALLGTKVKNREISARLNVANEKDDDLIAVSPVNSTFQNIPDVFPETSHQRASDFGIQNLVNIAGVGDNPVLFGSDRTVICAIQQVDREEKLIELYTLDEKGLAGRDAFAGDEDKLFWLTPNNEIWSLERGNVHDEVGFRIKDVLIDLSASQKSNAIMELAPNNNELCLLAGGTIYVYDFISRGWHEYNSSTTWNWLARGVGGELLACDDSDVYEIEPASGATETVTTTIRNFALEAGDTQIDYLKITYSSTTLLTLTFYDDEVGTNYAAIAPIKLLRTSGNKKVMIVRAPIRADRLFFDVTATKTSSQDWTIYRIQGFADVDEGNF